MHVQQLFRRPITECLKRRPSTIEPIRKRKAYQFFSETTIDETTFICPFRSCPKPTVAEIFVYDKNIPFDEAEKKDGR